MKKGVTILDGAKIGLLSGMGPLAGSDVLHKILEHAAEQYGAVEDVEYPDIVLLSHGIPGFDAQATMSLDFTLELETSLKQLQVHKPSVMCIACNTAHLCLDDIKHAFAAPIINLPEEVAKEAAKSEGTLLLLCSNTTKKSGLYHAALKGQKVKFLELSERKQKVLDGVIELVMAFQLPQAAKELAQIIGAYKQSVDGFIFGCTELPLVLPSLPLGGKDCVDSNQVLAKALVDHCYKVVETQSVLAAEPPLQKVQFVDNDKTKRATYNLLESNMLSYAELIRIPLKARDEAMVPLPISPYLHAKPIDPSMQSFTGRQIFVRKQVAGKLVRASKLLQAHAPDHALELVYGYRALSIQQKLFANVEKQLMGKLAGDELREACDRMVATPETAGHPAGAAVDIQITYKDQALPMGTDIWEFSPDTYVFSPFIGSQAWANRQLLRKVMTSVGFAPFDGEWWHFSYGDREWAAYYKRPYAIYDQIEFRAGSESQK